MNFFKTLLFICLTSTLFAERLEIASVSMKAMDSNNEIHLIGNVKIKEADSWLHGDEVIVYFNENNKTNKYEAVGSVKFKVKKEENNYKGSANKVIYYPLTSKYILTGKAIVHDLANKRDLAGDEITINVETGIVHVKGSEKRPIILILETEEKK